MVNVLFLAEDGKERGYGHLTRCKTLFDEFVASGYSTRMVVRGDKTISDWQKVAAALRLPDS